MTTLDHLDVVQEYALIRRGEHPAWSGDHTLNGEAFAWRVGYDFPGDAQALVQSLHDAETEYSTLTGLPPRSLGIMASCLSKGMRAALREAREDGRL
jgi:hypothetical protein